MRPQLLPSYHLLVPQQQPVTTASALLWLLLVWMLLVLVLVLPPAGGRAPSVGVPPAKQKQHMPSVASSTCCGEPLRQRRLLLHPKTLQHVAGAATPCTPAAHTILESGNCSRCLLLPPATICCCELQSPIPPLHKTLALLLSPAHHLTVLFLFPLENTPHPTHHPGDDGYAGSAGRCPTSPWAPPRSTTCTRCPAAAAPPLPWL
jgi:hypothetical protein